MNVFECYFKTIRAEYDKSVEYYYGTSENYSTIRGKYFNLINTYESPLIDDDILYNCFVEYGLRVIV